MFYPLTDDPMPAKASHDPDVELESRLTWIFGSPCTGSAWLLRMLIHPWRLASNDLGIGAPAGTERTKGPPALPIDESHLLSHLAPLRMPPYDGDAIPPPEDFIVNTRRAGDANYFFSELYADAWRPLVRRLILGRFGAHATSVERELGGRRAAILIREPNGSHGARLVMELLPSARIVFLMRDGRDVVGSQVGGPASGGDGPDSSKRPVVGHKQRLTEVLRNSSVWVTRMAAVQAAYEAHPPELRYALRYEDLRGDTIEQLRALRAWAGLPAEEVVVRAAAESEALEPVPRRSRFRRGTRAPEPDSPRRALTTAEEGVAEQVMGPKLRELGYSV
jgi:hypothetical protein